MMANLNFCSLLLILIVCCVVSMIEAHSIPLAEFSSTTISEREAKNLLLFPFQPIQSHSFGPQSRYGFGGRQTNSPISPAIAQNGLGPFFGIFPNLLTQPCPAAEKCPVCTECPETPGSCPSFKKLTNACLDTGIVRATGSDGIIEFDTAATPGTTKTCAISLFSIYDDKKIEFKCTNIASNVKINFSTNGVTPNDVSAAQGTVYTSPSDVLAFTVNNELNKTNNLKFTCTWKSV